MFELISDLTTMEKLQISYKWIQDWFRYSIYEVPLHFADRMPSENWMIIDDNRKKAVVHPVNNNTQYY